MPQLHDSY